jgi:predicted nucleotidyltransferase
MTSREDEVLQTAIQILRKELNPSRIILFGSRAKGRHADGSDFDLAVDKPKPNFETAWNIHETVNAAVGLFKVDIVYLPNVDSDFRELIVETGKVVYDQAA